MTIAGMSFGIAGEIVEYRFELLQFFVKRDSGLSMRRIDAPLAILDFDSCAQRDAARAYLDLDAAGLCVSRRTTGKH